MPQPFTLTRKEFFHLAGLTLTGMALLPSRRVHAQEPEYHGRVIDATVAVLDFPAEGSQVVDRHWKDTVLPITLVTTGPDTTAFNRVWYRIGEEGYVYSGSIQPVRVQLNPVIEDIPEGGTLAEVTVPFTDAHWNAGKRYQVAYRFYYETTHWVTGLKYDSAGQPWYKILDDLWKYHYYVPAEHLRLLPAEEIAPLSPDVPLEEKRIEINTADQYLVAIEQETPVFAARIASGAVFSNGDYSTPHGKHTVFHKRPSRHMAAGNLAANGYDLPGVPWVSYFTESGIAIHGTYWHNNYGAPRSHGCINLTPSAARWIFRWTLPSVPFTEQRIYEDTGTTVNVR